MWASSQPSPPINTARFVSRTLRQFSIVLLPVISAYCLLQCLTWTAVFSGSYGLPSQTALVERAHRLSLVYLWLGILAECGLVIDLAFYLNLTVTRPFGLPKAAVQICSALGIAALGTVVASLLLQLGGKIWRYAHLS
jgi:hypothetical protein